MTGPDRSRSVDEATLRYLARALGRRSEVRQTSLFPTTKLESLIVTLDVEYYPEQIDAVLLEIRAYTNGDFHVGAFARPHESAHLASSRERLDRQRPFRST